MDKTLLIGCGGAGTNIAEYLTKENNKAESLIINTDKNRIAQTCCDHALFIGEDNTGELITANCIVKQLQESVLLTDLLSQFDAITIIVGLGGLAGTTAITEVIALAKQTKLRINTVVILPFKFERKRRALALEKVELIQTIHTLNAVIFDNQLLIEQNKSRSLEDAFNDINQSINQAS